MKIKVTGYINTDDLDPELVDTSHSTGLSDEGFQQFSEGEFSGPEFEAQ